MPRRLLTWSLWGVTTAAATAMCWVGVSVVTATITPAHSPTIPANGVQAALAAGVPPLGWLPGEPSGAPPASGAASGALGPPATAGTNLPVVATGRGVVINHPLPARQAPIRPASAVGAAAPQPVSPDPRPSAGGSRRPGDDHSGPTSPSSSSWSPPPQNQGSDPVTATYSTDGGTVAVSCLGSVITLTNAVPADGYTLAVRSAGPGWVSVHFNGESQSRTVHAFCQDGHPATEP